MAIEVRFGAVSMTRTPASLAASGGVGGVTSGPLTLRLVPGAGVPIPCHDDCDLRAIESVL